MKVTLDSTSKVVQFTLTDPAGHIPARLWEGVTAAGIPCHAYIILIACEREADATEFEQDLAVAQPPSADIAAIPLRMVL
jgi:hypothetical protein